MQTYQIQRHSTYVQNNPEKKNVLPNRELKGKAVYIKDADPALNQSLNIPVLRLFSLRIRVKSG